MSCGVALAVSLLFSDPAVAASAAPPPAEASSSSGVAAQPRRPEDAPASVASEPLFADIVARSGALKTVVDGWIAAGRADQAAFWTGADFLGFKAQAADLAARDLQGHLALKERNLDGDLKCILRGISEDMPKKVAAVEAAPDAAERRVALDELSYLLNDNAEVITAPPQPPA